MNIGKAFLRPAGWGSVFPAKSCWDAWRSASWLARGQVNIVRHDLPNERQQMTTADRQNFVPQFIQLVKPWLYNMWSGIVMEKNWAHSMDQCQLQLLQFSVHLIDVLRVLLRCNGFSKIQKVVVDQNSSRPPTVTLTFFFFFGCNFGFGKCFGASSWSNHWAGHCQLSYKIHFLCITIRSRNGSWLLSTIREGDTS